MKYNFSVGWPGCFMEVLRAMDELQSGLVKDFQDGVG